MTETNGLTSQDGIEGIHNDPYDTLETVLDRMSKYGFPEPIRPVGELNFDIGEADFETGDSMGANFINSCLESIARTFERDDIEIVMSILSNYVPECRVYAEVSCPIENFASERPEFFAQKFVQAVAIADAEHYRAVTHNKGIMNGVTALALATGNDTRAIEAAAEQALARKTGARALRSIVEESLLDVMYDIPERSDVRKCIITEEVIRAGRTPLLLTKAHLDQGVDETNYDELVKKGA